MNDKKFDPKKLKKLNNPERLKDIPVDHIFDQLQLEQSEVFVEIGAGSAFFSVAFLQHATPKILYACDISTVMLDWIKENVVPDHPEIRPLKSGEVGVPLDDGIADLVFMIHLHHELESPQQMLNEAHRLLKVGGKVLVIDWKKEEMKQGPPISIRHLAEDVHTQLEKSGFKAVANSSELKKHFWVIGQK